MDLTRFARYYYDPTLTTTQVARILDLQPRSLSQMAINRGLPTRNQVGITSKSEASHRWRPGVDCDRCPLCVECNALQDQPGVIGVGCEVMQLDDGRWIGEDTIIYYRSPSIEEPVVGR